jgi:hypothetical protein
VLDEDRDNRIRGKLAWHIMTWREATMRNSGRSAAWCMSPFSAVDEMVSAASALASTLLAPPYMYATLAPPSCNALLIVAVRIEKNSAVASLASHTEHMNESSGHSRCASCSDSRPSSSVSPSISVNTVHAPSVDRRLISP